MTITIRVWDYDLGSAACPWRRIRLTRRVKSQVRVIEIARMRVGVKVGEAFRQTALPY